MVDYSSCKHVTEEEREDIRRMLMSGMTGDEIRDKTGRSLPTIRKIRKQLQLGGFDTWHRPGKISSSIPVATVDNAPKEESKVAEKKVESKPKTVGLCNRTLMYDGYNTEFIYTISTSDGIEIASRNGDNKLWFQNKGNLEAFVDELIDLIGEL